MNYKSAILSISATLLMCAVASFSIMFYFKDYSPRAFVDAAFYVFMATLFLGALVKGSTIGSGDPTYILGRFSSLNRESYDKAESDSKTNGMATGFAFMISGVIWMLFALVVYLIFK